MALDAGLGSAETLIDVDGEVALYRQFLSPEYADRLLTELLVGTDWRDERVLIFGRWVAVPRRIAWYGDAGADYRYAGVAHTPMLWTPHLTKLRKSLSATLGEDFNSVLLNLYRDGCDSMGWHSDDEPELGDQPLIASLSLGAVRRFRLRHRYDKARSIGVELGHGSLLLMRGNTQRRWQHALPKTRRAVGPRINLTFRQVALKLSE